MQRWMFWKSLSRPERAEIMILGGASTIAGNLLIPYLFKTGLIDRSKLKVPLPRLILLGTIQNAVMFSLASLVGVKLEDRTGLRVPYLRHALAGRPLPGLSARVPKFLILGSGAGVAIVALDFAFRPWLPKALTQADKQAGPLAGLLASFYGGIGEEVLLRRGVMTALVAGLAALRKERPPSESTLWTGNLGAAVLFGVGHLPAVATLTRLTPVVVVRTVLLNGIGGTIFGYLYAADGLETAIGAHFTADIVLHVLAATVAKASRPSSQPTQG